LRGERKISLMNSPLQTFSAAELFLPLLVGVATTVATLFIHGFSGRTMATLVARAFRRGLGESTFGPTGW
jgi:hypothetical protein